MINKAAYLAAILEIRFFELVYYIAHVVINVVNKGIMLRCILLTITIVGVSSIKILSQSQDPKCNPIQETHDVTLRVRTDSLSNQFINKMISVKIIIALAAGASLEFN